MNDIIEQEYCDVLHRIHIATGSERHMSPVTEDGVPIRKLFVSNLAERTTYKDLQKLFSKYGNIESCFLRRNHGKSNFAFVTFNSVSDAIKAREDGSKMKIRLHNRDLRVMPAYSWHQPENIENQYYSWKDWQKLENKLSNNQYLQDNVQNDVDTANIHMLNDDCLLHIFLYLPIVDRIRIERVCKRWRAVSQESWSSVKTLDLSPSSWGFSWETQLCEINTVTLRKVLLRCGQFLNNLYLSKGLHHALDGTTLSVVKKLCPNLKVIDVTGITTSPCFINALSETYRNITKFSLGKTTYKCDPDLTKFFILNPNLQYLKVVKTVLDGGCLTYLAEDTIEEIVLHDISFGEPTLLSRALTKFHNLKILSIRNCHTFSTGSVLDAIGTHCKKLKKLELSGGFSFTGVDDMKPISQLENLEVLIVWKNSSVTDEFLINLSSKCPLITYIDISNCHCVTVVGLAALAKLPKLETLIMNYLVLLCPPETKYLRLQGFCNLKHLQCRCGQITDNDAASLIERSPQLEFLDLSRCIITNETLKRAVRATNARKNNIILRIYIGNTYAKPLPSFDISPLLQVINVDLSVKDPDIPKRYLRYL